MIGLSCIRPAARKVVLQCRNALIVAAGPRLEEPPTIEAVIQALRQGKVKLIHGVVFDVYHIVLSDVGPAARRVALHTCCVINVAAGLGLKLAVIEAARKADMGHSTVAHIHLLRTLYVYYSGSDNSMASSSLCRIFSVLFQRVTLMVVGTGRGVTVI